MKAPAHIGTHLLIGLPLSNLSQTSWTKYENFIRKKINKRNLKREIKICRPWNRINVLNCCRNPTFVLTSFISVKSPGWGLGYLAWLLTGIWEKDFSLLKIAGLGGQKYILWMGLRTKNTLNVIPKKREKKHPMGLPYKLIPIIIKIGSMKDKPEM